MSLSEAGKWAIMCAVKSSQHLTHPNMTTNSTTGQAALALAMQFASIALELHGKRIALRDALALHDRSGLVAVAR